MGTLPGSPDHAFTCCVVYDTVAQGPSAVTGPSSRLGVGWGWVRCQSVGCGSLKPDRSPRPLTRSIGGAYPDHAIAWGQGVRGSRCVVP